MRSLGGCDVSWCVLYFYTIHRTNPNRQPGALVSKSTQRLNFQTEYRSLDGRHGGICLTRFAVGSHVSNNSDVYIAIWSCGYTRSRNLIPSILLPSYTRFIVKWPCRSKTGVGFFSSTYNTNSFSTPRELFEINKRQPVFFFYCFSFFSPFFRYYPTSSSYWIVWKQLQQVQHKNIALCPFIELERLSIKKK